MTNIHPATVTVGTGDGGRHVYKAARVRGDSTSTRIQVWVRSLTYPHTPQCVLDAPIVETIHPYNNWAPFRNRHGEWRLPGGVVMTADAEKGCGCGSPLKALPRMMPQSQADKLVAR